MKTAVIYWSMTGNTEQMAKAVAEGAGVQMTAVSDFDGNIEEYESVALGCPAMGAEELEDSEFEPFFSSVEKKLLNKRVLLFGSYGWGDGEWMRSWCERCVKSGISLIAENGVIANETPSQSDLDICREWGKKLAE